MRLFTQKGWYQLNHSAELCSGKHHTMEIFPSFSSILVAGENIFLVEGKIYFPRALCCNFPVRGTFIYSACSPVRTFVPPLSLTHCLSRKILLIWDSHGANECNIFRLTGGCDSWHRSEVEGLDIKARKQRSHRDGDAKRSPIRNVTWASSDFGQLCKCNFRVAIFLASDS